MEEAQVTGQLEHPGIVPVYDVGRHESGVPYYSMKLVRGKTLKDSISAYHDLDRNSTSRSLAFSRLLRNLIEICNAVAFAHQRGVLHRDLKPANVMLGEFGETLVLDWGLAKLVPHQAFEDRDGETTLAGTAGRRGVQTDDQTVGDDQTVHTQALTGLSSLADQTIDSQLSSGASLASRNVSVDESARHSQTIIGATLGTPAYMSPEQARGVADLDRRTDIYALGAILYHILTNHAPIKKNELKKMLRDVKYGRFKSPCAVDATIPKPLDAVCMKALATDRKNRYDDARELAADIEAFLADQPVSVYEEPWHIRAGRWARRHPRAVSSSVAAVIMPVAGFFLWNVAENHRIDGVRARTNKNIKSAEVALGSDEFDRAQDELNKASALVKAEESLADLSEVMGCFSLRGQYESLNRHGRL